MANGLLDYLSGFGSTPPEYLGGLLGQEAVDKLKGRAATTGIANAVLGYLAAPKNQNLGLGRIIGQSLQAGMTGAQGVYDNATQDYMMQQKIDEIKRQKAQRDAFDVAAKGLYTTTPAQYTTEQVSGGGYLPQTPDANAVAPNFGLSQTYSQPTTQQVMTAPAKTEVSEEALNAMIISGDPRAASYLSGLKTLSEIAAEKRKVGESPIGKLEPQNFTSESWANYINSGGDTTQLRAVPKNDTGFIQNYEYAKSKGYTGSPEDWQKLGIIAAQQFQAPYKQTEQEATQAATDYRYRRPQNFSVTAGGKVYYFPDQKSADAFKAKTRPK